MVVFRTRLRLVPPNGTGRRVFVRLSCVPTQRTPRRVQSQKDGPNTKSRRIADPSTVHSPCHSKARLHSPTTAQRVAYVCTYFELHPGSVPSEHTCPPKALYFAHSARPDVRSVFTLTAERNRIREDRRLLDNVSRHSARACVASEGATYAFCTRRRRRMSTRLATGAH